MGYPPALHVPPLVVILPWAALMFLLHWLDSPLLDFDFYGRRTLALGFLLAGVGMSSALLP